jgi:hypothetical protein
MCGVCSVSERSHSKAGAGKSKSCKPDNVLWRSLYKKLNAWIAVGVGSIFQVKKPAYDLSKN